jgi:hypothetical protein
MLMNLVCRSVCDLCKSGNVRESQAQQGWIIVLCWLGLTGILVYSVIALSVNSFGNGCKQNAPDVFIALKPYLIAQLVILGSMAVSVCVFVFALSCIGCVGLISQMKIFGESDDTLYSSSYA